MSGSRYLFYGMAISKGVCPRERKPLICLSIMVNAEKIKGVKRKVEVEV